MIVPYIWWYSRYDHTTQTAHPTRRQRDRETGANLHKAELQSQRVGYTRV